MDDRQPLRRTPVGTPAATLSGRLDVATFDGRDDGTRPGKPGLRIVGMCGAIRPGATPLSAINLLATDGWRRVRRHIEVDRRHCHPDAQDGPAGVAGSADLRPRGPSGDGPLVAEGNVIVPPDGTGNCRIDARDDVFVRGACPPGQEGRIAAGGIGPGRHAGMSAQIAAHIPRGTDPVHGKAGPLPDAWA